MAFARLVAVRVCLPCIVSESVCTVVTLKTFLMVLRVRVKLTVIFLVLTSDATLRSDSTELTVKTRSSYPLL